MKDTIVFCLKVDNEESYGEAANFIYKREQHTDLTNEDIKNVTYKYYLQNDILELREWVNCVIKDNSEFAGIKQAYNIKKISDQYEVVYCIYVNPDSDIVNLSNLYLLKRHYAEVKMIILFGDCTDKAYFTISQFLYSVGEQDLKFYNECFFEYKGRVKRAQKNNIYFSRYFTPLQVIDQDNLKRLYRECKGILTVEYLQTISSKNVKSMEGLDDLLDGAVKILYKEKHFSKIKEDPYIQILQRLDVMTFVLVCYAIRQQKEELSVAMLERYVFQMQQYSSAVRQLAENIIFHSKAGWGIIALRFHDKKSTYISDNYKASKKKNNYLEIIVSDFFRDNSSGNIADNFLAHLNNDQMISKFQGLCPRAFFDHDYESNIKAAWEEFYKNPDNIGKHFGLRIFQSIVSAFEGMFGAESHCGYRNMPGDSFLSYPGKKVAACMPGTRYHIVFPIENVQNAIKKQDLSLDSGINIGNQINKYFNYTKGKLTLRMELEFSQSQQQKNEQIRQMAELLQSRMEMLKKDIIYIPMNNMEDSAGEIIGKALILALFHLDYDVTVVLYQCTASLKRNIFSTASIFYRNADMEGMFFDRNVQIVMYSRDFEETVLDLSSIQNTDSINAYIAHVKCITAAEGYISQDIKSVVDLNKGAARYIPCDVLFGVKINGNTKTLFEHYTEKILKNSIQKSEFGCQLEHTHMRLGSTIHIDKFYEAEFLFGNKLFASRFALLLVQDLKDKIRDIPKLTLYGYGTYSETVLVQMVELIQNLYPDKEHVDYIILEREEERRGFLHKDRIRYNQYFPSKEERVAYYKDRKIAIVVLINSTLKTHMRLINLFREENGIENTDYQWLIKNYAVLLVGNDKTNRYWQLRKNNVKLLNEEILPVPQYFIQVNADYQEPLECKHCFPDNPVAEIPLVEVNAASTIPNQAFGIIEDKFTENLRLNYDLIREEEKQLACLKKEFTYGHVRRNENHFLYYFHTENICIRQREEIISSLKEWKANQSTGEILQYNIIVAPMHFSNAGFVELVNNVIFDGNAILLRIDFDKEYRCNGYTKYSYLRNYIEQLRVSNFGGKLRVHYVDDAIISGRTFFRAKSLLHTILGLDNREFDSMEIKLFDKVFVLVDRNSSESRRQYVFNEQSDYYAFVKVNISSLRNYGDSCVCCNLKKEADFLCDTASTKLIADYWKECAEKFQLYSLEEYNDRNQCLDYDKQFRRLFCTHMAQFVLNERYHGNDHVKAMLIILKLLNTDYESRLKDKYEYFLSYLKCISRPFLVFHKAIKEAIFDIMLILIDAIVSKKSPDKIIKLVREDKPYLRNRKLVEQFNKLNRNILENPEVTDKDKKDLVKLLMKQLTEMKSNYIIRPEKMNALFTFMVGVHRPAEEHCTKFEKEYLALIDRLVGASSDTNKSLWLDLQIMGGKFSGIPEEFQVWILLENTRTFRDGIEKLYKRIYDEKSCAKQFHDIADQRIKELEELYDYRRAQSMFQMFNDKNETALNIYRKAEDMNEDCFRSLNRRIERFIKSMPAQMGLVEPMNSARQSTDNWSHIFDCMWERIQNDYEEIENRQQKAETSRELRRWIEAESDMYQFSNFYSLLQEEQYGEQSGITSGGIDMLVCCAKVLALCRIKETPILEKVQLLAVLFKVILGAQKVQFIIENRPDRNLNEWKRNIENRYNTIVDKVCDVKEKTCIEKISIRVKGHYSVIVEKAGNEDLNTEVSVETEELIEKLESRTSMQHNYIIDGERGIVLWKLENEQRSIWINIENDNWCMEGGTAKLDIAKSVRKVMMFYQDLQSQIFNAENDDFINEISHTRKELNIYNSDKVYTHTKDASREILFEQVQGYFTKPENTRLDDYPSYLLKLLADINISQYYRYGLKVNSYQDDRGIAEPAQWGELSGLIKDEREFTYCADETGAVVIRLEVADIDEKEEILCRSSRGSVREMIMLIYALILNAAEKNRGKRSTSGIQLQQESVIVKVAKDDQDYLVIENECDSAVDIAQIKRKLHRIPDAEEDGISLWSFNCYIKQCINSLILEKLKELEDDISDNGFDQDIMGNVQDVGEWIEKLLSDEYDIQPEAYKNDEGTDCFRVKLPIFMKKYQPN